MHLVSEDAVSNPLVGIHPANVGRCAQGRAMLKGEECNAKGLNYGRSLAVIRVRGGCLVGLSN